MKKLRILIAFCLLFLFLFCKCAKDNLSPQESEKSQVCFEYFENEVKKEITVSDNTGENKAFFMVYAENKFHLENFLNSYSLNLITDPGRNYKDVFKKNTELKAAEGNQLVNFNLDESPKVYLELLYENIKAEGSCLFVEIVKSNLKSTNYIPGGLIGWTTINGDFLGTVHRGFGSEYLVQWTYKEKWYSKLKYVEIGDVNAWFIYPSGAYYGGIKNKSDWYKLNMIIRPDYYQTEVNYIVAYDLPDMRGHDCSIGSYDTYNCYVGSPPSGSEAFVYTYQSSGNTWFMYTPVNGNQCPLPGSSFDGANCQYRQVPDGADWFLWNNKWYVKPNIIEEFTYW